MRNIVYFLVFDGFADWQAALALCEIRRPGDFRLRTVALERRPVQSMGGMTVLPDLALDEIDAEDAVLMILPGGTAWERGEVRPVSATIRQLHDAGATIGALSSGVIALAYAGLVDTRRHTGDYAGHIETWVRSYRGAAYYDTEALALCDDGVITSGGACGVEFAKEVIRALDLYDDRDIGTWYRLFKHGVPPPWFAPGDTPSLVVVEERA